MTSYFERLIDFVGAHPQLSFLAVFLLALSEAVPVIGTVVPGSTLILAISALATAAGITPWALLVAAVLGAIAGDGFSFWLGHRYHRQILNGWPLNRFPWLIERSAQFIRKYGITSVFLARFTAVVRAFVHWDRNRARPAVGEGFPFLLFRSQDGFTVPPWLTFPEAPL